MGILYLLRDKSKKRREEVYSDSNSSDNLKTLADLIVDIFEDTTGLEKITYDQFQIFLIYLGIETIKHKMYYDILMEELNQKYQLSDLSVDPRR